MSANLNWDRRGCHTTSGHQISVIWQSHYTADGLNQPYEYSYLFAYPIEVAGNAKTLTPPKNDKIRILAISVANDNPELKPVESMFDSLEDKTAGR